jgi:outer membrane protein assembly factor BamB
VVPGKGRICSYDPATGEELWHCKWLADRVLGSVVTDDRHVYMTTAEPHGNILCIRADGKGDVSSTHLVWRSLLPDGAWGTLALAPPYLIHQQFDGTILALDSASGRNLWRVRTPGRLSHPPLIADRQLLTIDDRGGVHLLDVDRRGEGLLELNVPAGASQSLVIGNSSLLLRSPLGLSHLRGSSASQVAIEPRTSPRQQ